MTKQKIGNSVCLLEVAESPHGEFDQVLKHSPPSWKFVNLNHGPAAS